jgi:hypothetical protein
MGTTVYSGIIQGEPMTLDLRMLNNGLYYLVFPDEKGKNIKIIKI